MSSAARTIPAKRNVYQAKSTKIPSLDDYSPKKVSKTRKKFMAKNADVLIVKHKETEKQDGSDSNHFENEETWMTKKKGALESRLDKQNPLHTCDSKHGKGMKQNKGSNSTSESDNPTKKTVHFQQYENFMEERKDMSKLNEKYKQRIVELEEETSRIRGEFAKLYEDNEKLKRKMDTGKDPLMEPYSRVFEDRKILREAESGYKKRIIRLEKEITKKQTENDKFQDEVKLLKSKIKPTSNAEEQERKTKEMKLQVELKKLKKENELLMDKVREYETLNNKSELKRIKAENDTLRSIIKKLELQISNKPENKVKSTGTRRDLPKQTKESKQYQVNFEDRPVIFDYEYMLPDSQVYD